MRRLSLLLIAATGLGMIVVGLRYLLADEFMAYHAHVVQASWAELTPGVRTIIVGLMTIAGAGFVACGTALLWILPAIKAGERWAHWAVLSVGLLIGLPTLHVTIRLRQVAPGAESPVGLTAVLLACVVVGGLAHLRSLRSGPRLAAGRSTEAGR